MRKYSALFIALMAICYYSLQTACQGNPYIHGEILYQNFCANCHMEDGTGLIGNIPPLAQSDFLTKQAHQLPCIIRYGSADTLIVNGQSYNTPMAGVPELTDIEITNVINYINHAWGNENGFTKPQEVQRLLEICKSKRSSSLPN